jgi:endonuclease YncB( thermonuclease family)
MASWLVLLAVVAGGIALYDNRSAVLEELAPLLSPERKSAERLKPNPEPRRDASPRAETRSSSADARRPVPPVEVGNTKAAVPAAKPSAPAAATAELTGENFSGKFYFCGTSGLDNCVMSGDTFWYRKTKVVLADITAPRTEGAACQQERDRGFAAKVRLKELLGSGRFDLELLRAQPSGGEPGVLRVVTRNGRSLGSILVSEGLAKPRMARQQTWCP